MVPTASVGSLGRGLVGVTVGADGRVVIDWHATALYTGAVPARFVSEDDGRTHDLTGQAEPLLRIVDALSRHGVALGPTLDIRSHPEVRSEIQTILTEHEASRPATADGRSTSQRLDELAGLLDGGRISREEHDRLRLKILDGL